LNRGGRGEEDEEEEDIFDCELLDKPVKKKVKRQGPTLRSHSQVELPVL
jgi:hypothetical protein